MGLRVLAHFKPGDRATERLAAESDWLDVRWVPEDDDEAFYRELPEAEVIWHVLRPLSGSDLERAPKLKLIHKLGTGVNTIDLRPPPNAVSWSPTCPAPTPLRWPSAP